MPEKLEQVTMVCGHYVFEDEDVKKARVKLYKNVKALKITDDPEAVVIKAVKASIMKYVDAFNLKGLNNLIIS